MSEEMPPPSPGEIVGPQPEERPAPTPTPPPALEVGFERRRFEDLSVLQRSQIIATCQPLLSAVCRIDGLGTASLVAQDGVSGVLLTTAHVLPTVSAAVGKSAVFLEPSPGSTKAQIEVQLRPDKLFYTPPQPFSRPKSSESAGATIPAGIPNLPPPESMTDEYLPYCLVACDLVGQRGGSIAKITPLALPVTSAQLLASDSFAVGDIHLSVQHPVPTGGRRGAGPGSRKYHVTQVTESPSGELQHIVEYRVVEGGDYTASGSPWFDERGILVGIQHQVKRRCQGIRISSIVKHLFESYMLGNVPVPVLAVDPDLEDQYTPEGDRQPRKPGIFFEVLWDTWCPIGPGGGLAPLRALVGVVHAFRYCPALLIKAFRHMTDRERREQLTTIGEEGGVCAILQAMDDHAYDKTLIETASSALGSISAHPANHPWLRQFGCIPVALSTMREFADNQLIVQWCIFVLMHVCGGGSTGSEEEALNPAALAERLRKKEFPSGAPTGHEKEEEEARASLVALGGLSAVVGGMVQYPQNDYLLRWSLNLIAVLVPRHYGELQRQGAPTQLMAAWAKHPLTEPLVRAAVRAALAFACHPEHEVSKYLVRKGVVDALFAALATHFGSERVVADSLACFRQLCGVDPTLVQEFLDAREGEAVVLACTLHLPTSLRVVAEAVQLYRAVGINYHRTLRENELLDPVLEALCLEASQ